MDRREVKALAALGGKVFAGLVIVISAVTALIVALLFAIFTAMDALGAPDGAKGLVFVVFVLSVIGTLVFFIEVLANGRQNWADRWRPRNDR
jgi:hypothetical protein